MDHILTERHQRLKEKTSGFGKKEITSGMAAAIEAVDEFPFELMQKLADQGFMGINVPEGNFALVGMAGLIAGVIHAPLTAIFLIAEITGGYELFMPLMIVSTISYATVRFFISNSVYTIQLAKRGELMTHDKDKNVLLLMKVDSLIEKDFSIFFCSFSGKRVAFTALSTSC